MNIVGRFVAAGATLLLMGLGASAQTREPQAFVTHHREAFDGHALNYSATAGWTNVLGPDGAPWAQIFSVAYTKESHDRERPVMFIFNGGPGASSAFLHIAALGPKHVLFPGDLNVETPPVNVTDNPDSPLALADLVFIDPPETGYSHTLPADKNHDFASIEGDARIVGAFIRTWLVQHHREDSPKFVLGESYGATRAALVADQLADKNASSPPILLNGVALISQFLTVDDLGQRPMNAQGYAIYLPTMANVAWYHGKVDRAGRDFDTFQSDVRKFAFDDYLPALMQGNELAPDARMAVATRLSAITGIDAQRLSSENLKLTVTQFRHQLLPGRILGDYDGRYTAPSTGTGAEPASPIAEDTASDPSFSRPTRLVREALTHYLREDLGVKSDEEYKFTNNKLGPIWNFGSKFRKSAAAWLVEATEKNPDMHVFMASGRHDLIAPYSGTRFLLSQLTLKPGHGEFHAYNGGHMFYTNPDSQVLFSQDLKAFIKASLKRDD
jgi:carboxypeptidase C (cathepsin A)